MNVFSFVISCVCGDAAKASPRAVPFSDLGLDRRDLFSDPLLHRAYACPVRDPRLNNRQLEGIGQLWADSLIDPGRHASWLLIEEHAEGGDVLARLSRDSSSFLAGFRRECEGGGVALYRRVSTP